MCLKAVEQNEQLPCVCVPVCKWKMMGPGPARPSGADAPEILGRQEVARQPRLVSRSIARYRSTPIQAANISL